MTDINPDNILVNYGDSGSRFSDVELAHCGDSTHVDVVVKSILSGPLSFEALRRCPRRYLVFGSYGKGPSHHSDRFIPFTNFVRFIGLIWDWERIGMFLSPAIIDPTDSRAR